MYIENFQKIYKSWPDDELKCEPDVADELDEEEGLVGVGLRLVQGPVGVVAPVVPYSDVPTRHIYLNLPFPPSLRKMYFVSVFINSYFRI